jgi:hypothetical protein
MSMYLAVAGACAEQEANASGVVEFADLSSLSLSSSADYGVGSIEVIVSPTELIVGEYVTSSTTPAKSYTFSGSMPSFGAANDTLNLNGYAPRAFAWGDSGTYFYVGRSHSTKFSRFTCSTPYDIGTAGSEQTGSPAAWSPQGMDFNPDGNTMFAVEANNLHELSLSTAWQISSGVSLTSTTDMSVDTDTLGDPVGGMTGIRFSPTGLKMYISYRYDTSDTETGSQGHSKLIQYDLGTAWDVSSRSVNSTIDLHPTIGYFSFTPPNPGPPPTPPSGVAALVGGLGFSSDGTKLFASSAHQDAMSGQFVMMLFE